MRVDLVITRGIVLLDRAIQRVDGVCAPVPLFAALAVVLLLQHWPVAMSGNEENYFQLGYRTFAPDRFSAFHAVYDASLARGVPMYLLGAMVHLFGYDGAHALARILMAMSYAAGLAGFFSALRLSVWDALLVVVVFTLAGQQVLGGEWLFGGVEAKTMAYALLFFAFGLALRRRWMPAVLVGAAATYMHFLVGGFWSLIILLQQWWNTKQRSGVLRHLAVYALAILPLLGILVRDSVVGAAPVPGLANQIYAARAPWHVAPFSSRHWFWEWTPGIVLLVVLLLVMGTLHVRYRPADRALELVSRTAVVVLAWLVVALMVAFVDRQIQILGKFYLFRPSSLALFFSVVAIVGSLRERSLHDVAATKSLVIFALIAAFTWGRVKAKVDRLRAPESALPLSELVAAVGSHTAPGDIVLIEPVNELDARYISLHRLLPRPTLVARKFVPTSEAEILQWDLFMRLRQTLFERGCPLRTSLPVRWAVTVRPESVARLASCGPPVWRKDPFALIPVRKR